jgi:hypothetical protein
MAPQRLRVGRMRGPTVLGVLAAALLITALVITGRSQDRTGHPPSPSAGPTAAADAPYRLDGGYRCPLGRPVLGMADGRSYPPWHPARPPQHARAVACYQTLEEAAAAGYRPAPLPAGALVIGGVYLAPTDRAFRSRCQLAADRLGFASPARGCCRPRRPARRRPSCAGSGFPATAGRGSSSGGRGSRCHRATLALTSSHKAAWRSLQPRHGRRPSSISPARPSDRSPPSACRQAGRCWWAALGGRRAGR